MTCTEAIQLLIALGPLAFAAGIVAEHRYHLLGGNRRDRHA